MMRHDEEQQLLAQGLKDYVDAVNAINAFRSLVQRECRRVVEMNLDNYAQALGAKLSKDQVKEYEWSKSDGGEHSVGVKCAPNGLDEFSHCFNWYRAEGGGLVPGIYMSVWAKRKRIDCLREALRQQVHGYSDDGGSNVYLYEELTALDVSSVDTKLDALMERWIELWRKVGGLKALGIV